MHYINIKVNLFLKYFRYSYDPFTQSLNEFPEAEISVTAGDYVLVWGEADEDGYYEGNCEIFTDSVHIRFVYIKWQCDETRIFVTITLFV